MLGLRYRLVDASEMAAELDSVEQPIVFLSAFDYRYFGRGALRRLRDVPHFIWVPPSGKALRKIYQGYGVGVGTMKSSLVGRVVDSGAAFLWGNVTASGLEYYRDWEANGNRVVSLPLACDDQVYSPRGQGCDWGSGDMVFVGGYWKRKAIQLDAYLRPYEGQLSVYGYSNWPYMGYKGLIDSAKESALYERAVVAPTISEPHAMHTGDIVERGFKVLGSGGLTVTDAVPQYRELFSDEELLIPRNLDEFHDFVRQAFVDREFNERYRKKGYAAVMSRHTYRHRAKEVLRLLGLEFIADLNVRVR